VRLAFCSDERWANGLVCALEGSRWGALEVVRLWEFDFGLGELLSLSSLDLAVLEDASSDDLDRFWSGTMTTAHLHVHLRNGTAESAVSVLLVHVDGVCARQVSEHDSVVFHIGGSLLEDLETRRGSENEEWKSLDGCLPRWWRRSHLESF